MRNDKMFSKINVLIENQKNNKKEMKSSCFDERRNAQIKSHYTSSKLRIHHIAYSILLGRKYEEIELKVKENKKLSEENWKEINLLIKKYSEVNHEKAVCACS